MMMMHLDETAHIETQSEIEGNVSNSEERLVSNNSAATDHPALRQDQWDVDHIGDMMELQGNRITFTGGHADSNGHRHLRGNSAFLSNVLHQGVHRWTFKTNIRFCHWWSATIGIWKCSDNSSPPRGDIFTLGDHRGYGLNLSEGTLVDPMTGKVPSVSPVEYGKRCVGANVVEMVLDLDALTLKFVINGTDYGKAFDVERGSRYRAAINLSQIKDSVELL